MSDSKFDAVPSLLTVKRLVPKLTITDNPSEVFVVQFSPDGQLIAAGCNDGEIRVYHTNTGRLAYSLKEFVTDDMPITSLRFRPASASSKTKNVLLAVDAAGVAKHWHITSSRCMHTIREPDNQLFCVDYCADGTQFATAGKDRHVRVYDEATKAIITEMSTGLPGVSPGHSNRVFSIKYDTADSNIIVTGGWDNTVQIWDTRTSHAVRHIFGPHIAGDSVDICDGVILTGSWRPEHTLELWDLATCTSRGEVKWSQSAGAGASSDPCLLYAAKFSKDPGGTLIAAGGSGANEAKVFDRSAGNRVVGTVSGLTRGVFSVDWHQNHLLAVAGGDAAVRVYEVREGLAVAGEGSGTTVGAGGAGGGGGGTDGKEEDF